MREEKTTREEKIAKTKNKTRDNPFKSLSSVRHLITKELQSYQK
jgi:hypothetical protein